MKVVNRTKRKVLIMFYLSDVVNVNAISIFIVIFKILDKKLSVIYVKP